MQLKLFRNTICTSYVAIFEKIMDLFHCEVSGSDRRPNCKVRNVELSVTYQYSRLGRLSSLVVVMLCMEVGRRKTAYMICNNYVLYPHNFCKFLLATASHILV